MFSTFYVIIYNYHLKELFLTNLKNATLFVLLTFSFIIVAVWLSVLSHEYAHSTVAWLCGFKQNPFDIYYGHFNWQNVIFVTGIDENVNYEQIKLAGRLDVVGLVGFAGPAVTLLFYLITLLLLPLKQIKKHPLLYYFVFWINLLNLAELTSYIILRSIGSSGDIYHVEIGWNISPWLIFIIGGSIIVYCLWYLFSYQLDRLYSTLKLTSNWPKAFILTLAAFQIFGHSGFRMLLYPYGTVSLILGIVFIMLVPLVIYIKWPARIT